MDDRRRASPAGVFHNPNPARLPGNGDDQYSISTKLTYFQSDNLKWLATFQNSRKQRRAYTHGNIFNNPLRSNIAARIATYNVTGGLDWIIEQNALRNTNFKVRANLYRNRLVLGTPTPESLKRNTWGGFSL